MEGYFEQKLSQLALEIKPPTMIDPNPYEDTGDMMEEFVPRDANYVLIVELNVDEDGKITPELNLPDLSELLSDENLNQYKEDLDEHSPVNPFEFELDDDSDDSIEESIGEVIGNGLGIIFDPTTSLLPAKPLKNEQ